MVKNILSFFSIIILLAIFAIVGSLFNYYYFYGFLILIPIILNLSVRLRSFALYKINLIKYGEFYDLKKLKNHIKMLNKDLHNYNNLNYIGDFGSGKTIFITKIFKHLLIYKYSYNVIYKNIWWFNPKKYNFSSPKINGNAFGISIDLSRFTVFKFVYYFLYISFEFVWWLIWILWRFWSFTNYKTVVIIDEPNKGNFDMSYVNRLLENNYKTILISNDKSIRYTDKIFSHSINHIETIYGKINLRNIKVSKIDSENEIKEIFKNINVCSNNIEKYYLKIFIISHMMNKALIYEEETIKNMEINLKAKSKISKKLYSEKVLKLQHDNIRDYEYYHKVEENYSWKIKYEQNYKYIYNLIRHVLTKIGFRKINIYESTKKQFKEYLDEMTPIHLFIYEYNEILRINRIYPNLWDKKLKELYLNNKSLILYFFDNAENNFFNTEKYVPDFIKNDLEKWRKNTNYYTEYTPDIKYNIHNWNKNSIEKFVRWINEKEIVDRSVFMNQLIKKENIINEKKEDADKKDFIFKEIITRLKTENEPSLKTIREKAALFSLKYNIKNNKDTPTREYESFEKNISID